MGKRAFKRITSLILTIGMIISLTPTSVFAEETATGTDAEQIEISTESEEEESQPFATDDATDTNEISPTFNQIYGDIDISGIDFSSCELLIATDDTGIFTADTEVVSEYNGIYLTRYPDIEQTKSAYTYYYNKAALVETNTTFKGADEENGSNDTEEASEDDGDVPLAENTEIVKTEEIANDGHGEADLSDLNSGDDAFSQMDDLTAVDTGADIALIDTGASGQNIVKSVSVIGDTAADDNGHGTKMYETIIAQNPDAKILSIKALGSDNKGQASDIYAAIRFAIDSKVKVINLSLSSVNTQESSIVIDAINEAIEKGIIVVGAAGNYGKDAKYFVPGCVDGAIICSATDENGVRLDNANYGEKVDYYVVADSTSYATAIVTGLISKDGIDFTSDIVRTKEAEIETAEETTNNNAEKETVEETTETEEDDAEKAYEKDKEQAKLINDLLENNPWLDQSAFYGQAPGGLPDSVSGINVIFVQDSAPKANFSGHVVNTSWPTGQSWSVICASGHNYADPGQHYGSGVNIGVGGITMYYYKSEGGYAYYRSDPKAPAGLSHDDGWQEMQFFCRVPLPPKTMYGAIQVLKVDQNGNALKGAKFEVTGPNGYSKIITTASWGLATASELVAGNYTVEEIEAPAGYKVNSQRFNVTISFSNTFSTVDQSYSYLFDKPAYEAMHPSTVSMGAQTHYLNYGLDEGIKSSYTFNPVSYKNQNSSLGLDGYEAWSKHYQNYGAAENRKTLSDTEYAAFANDSVNGSGTGLAIVKVSDALEEYPAYAYVKKQSAVSGVDLDLSGAIFRVYDDANDARVASDSGDFTGALFKLTTDETGNTNIKNVYQYLKTDGSGTPQDTTFYVVEQKAPTGFAINKGVFELNVSATNNNTKEKAAYITIKDNPKVYFTMRKKSSNTDCSDNNPNYNLNGTAYEIYKEQQDAINAQQSGDYSGSLGTMNIKKNGDSNNTIEVTEFMDTNTSGAFRTTEFWVVESKTGKGYIKDKTVHRVRINPTTNYTKEKAKEDANIFEATDEPVRDPVEIKVLKSVDGATTAEYLEGAEFTLKHYPLAVSMNYSFEDLKNYTPDETIVITTEKQADGNIYAKLPTGKRFSAGYLTIEETKAPDGYKIDGSKATVNGTSIPAEMDFVLTTKGSSTAGYEPGDIYYIDKDGNRSAKIENISGTNEIVIKEQMNRADIEVIKYKQSDEGNIGAKFEITNLDTNESHTFTITEMDGYDLGYYTTHSDFISHSAENGIWFAESAAGGSSDTPDDVQGALPVGKYKLTETDANGQQKEEPLEFEITDDDDGETIRIYDKGRGDGLEVINDMNMPTLGTEALVETKDGLIKELPADKGQTIHDICKYTNLRYNTEFTLVGTLMKKNKDGSVEEFINPATGEKTVGITNFKTADTYEKSQFEASGEEIVEFKDLDFTDLEKTEFVVYEELYLGTLTLDDVEKENYDKHYVDSNNDVVTFPIEHKEKGDVLQTVKTAWGQTNATAEDGTKTVTSIEEQDVTIVDEVEYHDLHVGTKYTVKGKLYLISEGEPDGKKYSEYSKSELEKMAYKDADGNVVEAEATFKADKTDGTVKVTFTFKSVKLKKTGQSVVIFEDCYDENGVKWFSHAEIDDTQIVSFPSISTTAKGTEGRSELAYNEGKFIDTIHYENLEANAKYTVRGIAMDKKTGEPLKLNGKTVAAESTFETGDANMDYGFVKGDYDLQFTIAEDQYEDLKGKDIVIYESLYNSAGTLIAQHNDLSDKGQELWIVKLGTTLTDKKTGTHVAYPDQETTLVDVVSYESLIPGKKYVMSGKLMNKATNKPLLDENGKEITSSTEFTASDTGKGTVEVIFTFNAKILKIQGTSIVAFESVKPNDSEIDLYTHADINDKDQTVDIPKVGTKVSKSSFSSKETIKFTDTISFTNLPTEYTYVAKGWLVDSKGNKLTVDGKEITAEKEFKPEKSDGTVDVVFPEFSGKGLNGKYVVYEEVYVKLTDSTHLVGEHKDLTDTNQQISVSPNVKTGDEARLMLMIMLCIMALVGIGSIVIIKKKER